jgi:hypothetical protein
MGIVKGYKSINSTHTSVGLQSDGYELTICHVFSVSHS